MSLESQELIQGAAGSFATEKTATIGKYITCPYRDAGTTEKVSFCQTSKKQWNLDKKRGRREKGHEREQAKGFGEMGGGARETTWRRYKQKAV